MSDLAMRGKLTKRDLARGRNLKIGAWSSPFLFSGIPAVASTVLLFLFGVTPPIAATILFFGIVATVLGFAIGIGLTGFFAYRHRQWTIEMRERIAANGIRAEELEWFRHELKPSEKRALKQITRRDLLLADAYRETLASRITASRIVSSSRRELSQMQRRQNKLRYLNSTRSREFAAELENDLEQIRSINTEAKEMLAEAESRLQMIEAASVRGSSLADSELALKKLSARAAELPLALESAKMAESIRAELDSEAAKLLDEIPEDTEEAVKANQDAVSDS